MSRVPDRRGFFMAALAAAASGVAAFFYGKAADRIECEPYPDDPLETIKMLREDAAFNRDACAKAFAEGDYAATEYYRRSQELIWLEAQHCAIDLKRESFPRIHPPETYGKMDTIQTETTVCDIDKIIEHEDAKREREGKA